MPDGHLMPEFSFQAFSVLHAIPMQVYTKRIWSSIK